MTSPKFAHQTENGRYYTRPGTGEELVSVTNALSVGMAKYGLPLWYARLAAEYAIENQGALMRRSRTDPDGAVTEIKEAAERAKDAAADMGTRVHALAEAHLLGQTLAPQDGDDIAGLFIKQYEKFLADFEIELDRDVIATEMTVANLQVGYAGTLDIILRLPLDGFVPGMALKRVDDPAERGTFLIDIKTSLTRSANQCYPENALQLTGLRDCREAWMPDGSIEPMPKGITGCAVLNLRQKSYELIPMPTRDLERAAFRSVVTLAKWKHDEWQGEYDYRPVRPSGRFKPKRGTTADETSPQQAKKTRKVA